MWLTASSANKTILCYKTRENKRHRETEPYLLKVWCIKMCANLTSPAEILQADLLLVLRLVLTNQQHLGLNEYGIWGVSARVSKGENADSRNR